MTQTDSPRMAPEMGAPAMEATAGQDFATNPGLFEAFRTARARARGPIVCVDADVLLINAAASRFVTHDDHHELWHWAQRALDTDDSSVHALPLLGRQLQARCGPISTHGLRSGALIRIVGPEDGERRGRHRPSRLTVGWSSLRESERGIAELVAAGMTNREIGDRLYLSRHTVDAHLRQIFRKLDIRSRVELTRIVVEHALVADAGTQGAGA